MGQEFGWILVTKRRSLKSGAEVLDCKVELVCQAKDVGSEANLINKDILDVEDQFGGY